MFKKEIEKYDIQNPFKSKYDNFIGGKWVAPVKGEYFENVCPIYGETFTEIARSSADDIEMAIDYANKVKECWGMTSANERSNILLRIADRMEANQNILALAETIDNGKPIRETKAADVPLAIDHFRYFASCIRAQEGSISQLDHETIAYHMYEPIGVVGQIIPWNFPLLMAAWKIAPALAAGNCIILKPAEQTPASVLVWLELIQDLIPPGVLNIVNGFGLEAGKPLATSAKINKIAFTGETNTGKLILQYAAQNLIPATLELGGKSPNVFFPDVMDKDDEFLEKAVEGFIMFAFNQGEVCTCPSRALIHESIYDVFMEKALTRISNVIQGNPLNPSTMIGAQVSQEQMERILSYIDIGKKEGAKLLVGGNRKTFTGALEKGYYIEPTVFKGENNMRIFQEEIFGPVLSVTTFKDEKEALKIANETSFGLGAGVWTRNLNRAFKFGRDIKAGRVWTNCYHLYPAHAAFGGYKQSGIGRENHKMMLEHYQHTKNLLVSYDTKPLGLF